MIIMITSLRIKGMKSGISLKLVLNRNGYHFYVHDVFLASNIVQLIFLGFSKGNSDLNLHCFMIYHVHAPVSKY